MERHVRIGNVVTHDEETHGHMIGRWRKWVAFFLTRQNLEVIDDGMSHRLATVAEVSFHNTEFLLIKIGFCLHQIINLHGVRQNLEAKVRYVRLDGLILYTMTFAHVAKDSIGIPCALHDEVAIIHKPADEALGIFSDGHCRLSASIILGNICLIEALDGHKGQPCMCELFHSERF